MWDGGRRYYARFEYDQKQFHCRVMKAVVDGFSCPNLDGTKGTGGCIFCDGGSWLFYPFWQHCRTAANRTDTHSCKVSSCKADCLFSSTHKHLCTALYLKKNAVKLPCNNRMSSDFSIGKASGLPTEDVLDYLEELSHRMPFQP